MERFPVVDPQPIMIQHVVDGPPPAFHPFESAITFSSTGSMIAAGYHYSCEHPQRAGWWHARSIIRIYDAGARKYIREVFFPGAWGRYRLIFLDDGRRFVIPTMKGVTDTLTGIKNPDEVPWPFLGKEYYEYLDESPINRAVTVSHDGHHLATIDWKISRVYVWNIMSGTVVNSIAVPLTLRKIAFSQDDTMLIIMLLEGPPLVWCLEEEKCITLKNELSIEGISCKGTQVIFAEISRDRRFLVATVNPQLRILVWDLETLECVKKIRLSKSKLPSCNIDFHPKSPWLIFPYSNEIHGLFFAGPSVDNLLQVPILTGLSSFVRRISFSPDGRVLATVHNDGRLILWEMKIHASEWRPEKQYPDLAERIRKTT